MLKESENNGTEEIGSVTATPDLCSTIATVGSLNADILR